MTVEVTAVWDDGHVFKLTSENPPFTPDQIVANLEALPWVVSANVRIVEEE